MPMVTSSSEAEENSETSIFRFGAIDSPSKNHLFTYYKGEIVC